MYEHDSDFFTMRIIGYQFPEIVDQEDDSNWLMVEIHTRVDNRSWESRDPSILTYELWRLIKWLEAVTKGEEDRNEVGFIEPNLGFEFIEKTIDGYRFRVRFEMESRPDWARFNDVGFWEFFAEIVKTPGELQAWIDDLKNGLSEFQPRAGVMIT